MGKLSIGDKLIVQEPFPYSGIRCNDDMWYDRGDVLSIAAFSVSYNEGDVLLEYQASTMTKRHSLRISLSNLECLIKFGILTMENRRENA